MPYFGKKCNLSWPTFLFNIGDDRNLSFSNQIAYWQLKDTSVPLPGDVGIEYGAKSQNLYSELQTGLKFTGFKKMKTQKLSKNQIKEKFNKAAENHYKNKVPRWFPEHKYIYGSIVNILKYHLPEKSEILDMGAGSGNLTKTILKELSGCNITLIDFSEKMLEQAKIQLKKYKKITEFKMEDMFNAKLKINYFDAIVSSFAIHHARSNLIYQKLYKKIFLSLKKSGLFLCADIVEGNSQTLSEYHMAEWKNFLSKYYNKKFVEQLIIWQKKEDSPISIYEHLVFLKKAGFKHVDVIFKKFNFGIYIGIK